MTIIMEEFKKWLKEETEYEMSSARKCDDKECYQYHCGRQDAYTAVYFKIVEMEKEK